MIRRWLLGEAATIIGGGYIFVRMRRGKSE